jgi:hypothetical protein
MIYQDSYKIEAHYEHGAMKLRLPRAEEARPKQIQIQINRTPSKTRTGKAKEEP